jgi:Domain of unknown function (DUF6134)
MNIRTANISILLIFAAGIACAAPVTPDSATREWNFRVYLGDSPIGNHRFRLTEQQGQKSLAVDADFKVRFLFFTAYRYRHSTTEIWSNDCLQKIESYTDANGRVWNVQGSQAPDGFSTQVPESQAPLADCVKTFAYWDADILHEKALLNPQTGELVPVTVEQLADETVHVRGRDVAARKYRLLTRDLSLDLWYSNDSEWLALTSTTKDGRTLRYELI